jgi:hypothetical protein
MKNRTIAACSALLLSACASAPVAPPAPIPCPVAAEVIVAAAVPDQSLEQLLAFQAGLRSLKSAELAKALAASDSEPVSADAPLRRALLLAAQKDEVHEKLALQLREAQRRNEQLSEKLEALKNIERSLSVPVPAPPK